MNDSIDDMYVLRKRAFNAEMDKQAYMLGTVSGHFLSGVGNWLISYAGVSGGLAWYTWLPFSVLGAISTTVALLTLKKFVAAFVEANKTVRKARHQ